MYEQIVTDLRHEVDDLYQVLISPSMQKSSAVRPTRTTIRSRDWDRSDTFSLAGTESNSKRSDLADSNDKTRSVNHSQILNYLQEPSTDFGNRGHPCHLDTAQIALDFVLDLEKPQSPHHVPTFQDDEFFAVEVDKLLYLSSQLSLDGGLTPIEAWQRIKEHPGFVKLNRDGLEQLKVVLLPGINFHE